MPELQREGFEQRLLDDDAFSEQINQAQQELLEDYAAGALSSIHRKQLGPWVFYSSGRRQHVQLIADLLYRARRSRVIVVRRYIGIAAACVLLAVGLRLLHPLQYSRSDPTPTAHVNQPTPTFAASSEPSVSTDTAEITNPDAPTTIRPSVIVLIPERLHGESQSNTHSVYAIQGTSPILMQVLVPSTSNDREYTLTIHPESDGASDHRFDHLTPLAVRGSNYVEADLPPGSLPPGQYTARLSTSEGPLTANFIVHY